MGLEVGGLVSLQFSLFLFNKTSVGKEKQKTATRGNESDLDLLSGG